MTLVYSHTNESLWSVMQGLSVNASDVVLAVAGSGDQGFAVVEKAKKVVMIDNNAEQINYSRRRADALAQGKFDDFLPLFDAEEFVYIKNEHLVLPKDAHDSFYWTYLHYFATMHLEDPKLKMWSGAVRYFLNESVPSWSLPHFSSFGPERMQRIRQRLACLQFVEGDILDVSDDQQRFSKVYLSNILSGWGSSSAGNHWMFAAENPTFCGAVRVMIDQVTLPECLLYSTVGVPRGLLSSHWVKDDMHTGKAQVAEVDWKPVVYKRQK